MKITIRRDGEKLVTWAAEFGGYRGEVPLSGIYVDYIDDETLSQRLAEALAHQMVPDLMEKVIAVRQKDEDG